LQRMKLARRKVRLGNKFAMSTSADGQTELHIGTGHFTILLFGLGLVAGACGSSKVTGVEECDRYLAKYERCVATQVPKDQRKPFENNLDRTRTAWSVMSRNPGVRPGLSQACTAALDRARLTMESYH